jgi:hypothetical protein
MLRRCLGICTLIVLAAIPTAYSQPQATPPQGDLAKPKPVKVKIDQTRPVTLQMPSVGGDLLAPVDSLAKAIGAKVTYSPATHDGETTQEIVIAMDATTRRLTLWENSRDFASAIGDKQTTGQLAFRTIKLDGTMYALLKDAAPGLAFSYAYDAAANTVSLKTSIPDDVYDLGPKDAKVFVRAFYPGIHQCRPVRQLVLSFALKYPGKVRGRFVPFDTEAGEKEWHDAGLFCGGVLVNGKQSAEVKGTDGKTHTITFKQRMGDLWTPEDLKAAVAAEVAKVYPK